MYIHEYQAKSLLQRAGVEVPPFAIASNEEEVQSAIRLLGLEEAVIKVQIHAGGRGKAGGVKFAKNKEEIVRHSRELLGMRIETHQTGPGGVIAHKVMISNPIDIKKEYYLAVLIDRSLRQPVVIVSPEGGMEIEEIAEKSPEKILKVPFQRDGTLYTFQLLEIGKFMGWSGELLKQGMEIIATVARLFIEKDASLFEINPLVETTGGQLTVLDAKMAVDDSALFRQPAMMQWYDPTQQTPGEVEAKKQDLAYIGLEGNIGCLVNGAGLAMATMDIIQHYGGAPANFLDVGGSATKEAISHGFSIITSDSNVKAIFVNIFGGIMDCSVLAQGVVESDAELKVPLVVRMEGTNVEKGREILAHSGLDIISTSTMEEGAVKAVKAAKER